MKGHALVALVAVCWVHSAAVAAQSCDSALLRMASGTNPDRLRGNRCEGTYGKRAGGSTIALVAFTELFQPDENGTDTMRVTWPASTPGDTVQLRSEFLRRNRFYRMDAARTDTGAFLWPSGLLAFHSARPTLRRKAIAQ